MKNPFKKKEAKPNPLTNLDLGVVEPEYFEWLKNPPKFHCENYKEKNPTHSGFKCCTEQCDKCRKK